MAIFGAMRVMTYQGSKVTASTYRPIATFLQLTKLEDQKIPDLSMNSKTAKNQHSGDSFRCKKAVVVSKFSRYQFEKQTHSELSEDDLMRNVSLI